MIHAKINPIRHRTALIDCCFIHHTPKNNAATKFEAMNKARNQLVISNIYLKTVTHIKLLTIYTRARC